MHLHRRSYTKNQTFGPLSMFLLLLLFSTQIDVPYSRALLNGHRCHSRLQSNTQLEGKVSWLLSLEWSNVGRGAIITGIHHHPVTRVNNISDGIGICLHLTTIHQVVGCQPHPLHHAHSHEIQLSCQNVRGRRGLRAPIRKIIAWHLDIQPARAQS